MGVTFDASQLEARLEKIEKTLGHRGIEQLVDSATAAMEAATERAIAGQHDPATGAPWAPRVGSYPWRPLRRTGTMLDSLGFKGKALKVKGWAKTTTTDRAVVRPSGQVQTVRNLAWLHLHGSRTMAARPFFLNPRSKPPQWLVRRVKAEAERLAARAVR